MKTIVYNGNSKIIKRIVALLNGKAPMPLDANNDVTWGTNGQVLTTDGNGATSWTNASGGSDVSFSQTLTSGTEVGEITIDETTTKMYAPTPPTKVSDLSNDSGFITSTVNNLTNYYLKSETYTQAEVDSLISAIVTLDIQVVQALPTQDISTTTIYLVPKATAETQDIYDEYIYVNSAWEHIGSTQVDLSDYYNKTEVDDLLDDKVDKVTGKGLSTNDFTNTLKTKLDGIETGAEVNVQADWNEADTTSDAYIQNKPTIPTVNDATLTIQQNGTTVNTFTANASSNVTANITVPTKTSDITNDSDYVSDASYVHTDNNFTSTLKTKLDGIASGAEVNVQADWSETTTSSDAYIKNKPTLATVATSGSYNDLSDTPTIPTVNDGTVTFMQGNTNLGSFSANQSSNATITIPTSSIDINNETPTFTEASTRANIASGETIATLFGKIKKFFTDLASVAFSGSYNDLSDKPTIPTVNNATLTIQKNGTNVQTFTANASSNKTANITVPTKVSELTADVGKAVYYGTCATAAATAAKVVTVSAGQNFALEVGAVVGVKFTYTNSYSATASSGVTLNVNSTGAKKIYWGSSSAPTGTNTTAFGRANYINYYMYDGTYWVWVSSSADNNTTYSAMSVNELTKGTATNSRVVRADYLKSGINTLIDNKIGEITFVLKSQTLTFSNLVATVSDSRVTADTSAMVFFNDATLQAAANAGVVVDTSSGTITFTATTTPSSNLVCDIVCRKG